jgi:hypothetical protein
MTRKCDIVQLRYLILGQVRLRGEQAHVELVNTVPHRGMLHFSLSLEFMQHSVVTYIIGKLQVERRDYKRISSE